MFLNVINYATKATEEAVSAATALATSEVQSEGKCDYFGVCCDVNHLKNTRY